MSLTRDEKRFRHLPSQNPQEKLFMRFFVRNKVGLFLSLVLLSFACAEGYYISKNFSNSQIQSKSGRYAASFIGDSLLKYELQRNDFEPVEHFNFGLTYEIFGSIDSSINQKFVGFSSDYSDDAWSIFCFRGNHQRNSPSRGTVVNRPNVITLDWEFQTAYDGTTTDFGTWGGGAGWTGQPMIIRWDREQKVKLGIQDSVFLNNDKALELIIGSLCGNIYFLDAETGQPTRPHLSIGNPIKGSVSVDPRKNGLLYVGQGIQHGARFGAYVFDMFSREEILHINGKDVQSVRRWGAFDSNPIVERHTGQIFWPAENGMVYSFHLSNPNDLSRLVKMQYHHKKLPRRGIESSMAVVDQYGFFCDNSGSVICMDLKNMRPIWNVSNYDDSDATITIDKESDGSYALYTGNEVDLQAPVHTAYFRKLDAATGDELWKVGRKCRGTALNGKTNSGGMLSSPAIGKNKGKDLVYCIFSRVDEQNRGEFIAISKQTGEEIFSMLMPTYSWSSPVDIYDEEGNIYIFFTDVSGSVYLIDGLTGELLIKEKMNYTFESTPVIVNDRVFIASRGRSILSFKLNKNAI